jgi:hypothetical protein
MLWKHTQIIGCPLVQEWAYVRRGVDPAGKETHPSVLIGGISDNSKHARVSLQSA